MNITIANCFDNRSYAELAWKSRVQYQNNLPFHHIVFDNFLPDDVAIQLASDYPSHTKMKENWKHHENDNVSRFFLEDSTQYSDNMRLFSAALASRSFLLFLETLTGINALLPDPYLIGGGAMVTGRNGFLKTHVDFNWHQKLQAWRRCNALFYLTPNWSEEWGGELELWETDGSKAVRTIEPIFNRVVIFSTTKYSYHGQPKPLSCPDNIYRRVFSAFYYSTTRNNQIDEQPHYTRYNGSDDPKNADRDSSPYSDLLVKNYLRGLT